jgi:DNA-binding MarR family transcriptional regulator
LPPYTGGMHGHLRLEQADLDSAVTWTLTRAARHVERKLTEVIAGHGLTPVQYGVLAQLATNDSMTRAQLARATLTTPQSMAGVIDGMVEKGLIAFAGESGKGRPNPLMLTEFGHETVDVVWPAVLEHNRAHPLGLTEAEVASLDAILQKLLRA